MNPTLSVLCALALLAPRLLAVGVEANDDITPSARYVVEISFDGSIHETKAENRGPLAFFTAKIVYRYQASRNQLFQGLESALKSRALRKAEAIDTQWSVVISTEKEFAPAISHVYCFDLWAKKGWADGLPVEFDSKLMEWIKAHLSEAFELR